MAVDEAKWVADVYSTLALGVRRYSGFLPAPAFTQAGRWGPIRRWLKSPWTRLYHARVVIREKAYGRVLMVRTGRNLFPAPAFAQQGSLGCAHKRNSTPYGGGK